MVPKRGLDRLSLVVLDIGLCGAGVFKPLPLDYPGFQARNE